MNTRLELENTSHGAGYLSPGEASLVVTSNKSLTLRLASGKTIGVGHSIEDIYTKLEIPYLLESWLQNWNN